MLKIWKRILIPGIIFLLFVAGFLLCDGISDPEVSGAIGSVALFILFPLFIITLIWALVSGTLLSIRYRKYPHLTMMELNHTRIETLQIQLKEERKAWKKLTPAMRKRCRLLHIGGASAAIIGFLLICTWNMNLITVGTIVLIFGCTAFMFSFPNAYNNEVDIIKRIPVTNPVTIEKIFEDIRTLDTVLGSAALGNISTMKQKCILFGPAPGQYTYLYGYLNDDGSVFYLGEAVLDGFIETIYETPLIPPHEPDEATATLSSVISYNANAEFLKYQLFDFFMEYFKNGTIGAIPMASAEGVYLFDEHFKLTGQEFTLTDTNSNPIYSIEATYPLKSFHIYEDNSEIFYITKELVHALPTYRFTRRGEFYGVLEKEIAFAKDRFAIGTPDGQITLESMTAMLGNNFQVKCNGRLIGLIMDNLSITFRNVVFDNSVITVYDEYFRDVITAMAVMAVREIARDREKS